MKKNKTGKKVNSYAEVVAAYDRLKYDASMLTVYIPHDLPVKHFFETFLHLSCLCRWIFKSGVFK